MSRYRLRRAVETRNLAFLTPLEAYLCGCMFTLFAAGLASVVIPMLTHGHIPLMPHVSLPHDMSGPAAAVPPVSHSVVAHVVTMPPVPHVAPVTPVAHPVIVAHPAPAPVAPAHVTQVTHVTHAGSVTHPPASAPAATPTTAAPTAQVDVSVLGQHIGTGA
jgi:hypothetical protein